MPRIQFSDERRDGLLRALVTFYAEEFDEPLSKYRSERLLEFFTRDLGPSIYNQAIQDARAFMFEKLEDLDVEFYEPETPDGGS